MLIPKPTTIDILRHGEVAGPACFRGSTDTTLTTVGLQQMLEAVEHRGVYDAIISSPLSRCLSFARNFASSQQLPLEIVDDFAEINFGDWELKTADEITLTDPDALMRFYQDPTFRPPGNAESQNQFFQRTQSAWQLLVSNYAQQNILLVTHAGVIRMIFALALNIPLQNTFNIQVDFGCLSRFTSINNATENFTQLCLYTNLHKLG